jgi:RNA polymerase sigma factor (TIGR02999 family)
MGDVTLLLNAIEAGNGQLAEELLPVVYEELRSLAARKIAAESPGHTLQATALVHEAYLRLVGDHESRWRNSKHFFCAAAEAMRRILVERARHKARRKHGGGKQRVTLDEIEVANEEDDQSLLFVHEALEKLGLQDPTCAELVRLRFFGGLTHQQASRILAVSERTARRNWMYARAWLRREFEQAAHKDRDDGRATR